MKNKLAFYLAVSLGACLWAGCSGCVGYRHSREVTATTKKESTTFVSLFKKGEAEMMSSETVDGTNGYSRTIGAKRAKTTGDAETLGELGNAVRKNNPYVFPHGANPLTITNYGLEGLRLH